MRLCCSKGIYSTTGVHGGGISGLGAEGAVKFGLYPLYMVYFFTKLIIYYNKLVARYNLRSSALRLWFCRLRRPLQGIQSGAAIERERIA